MFRLTVGNEKVEIRFDHKYLEPYEIKSMSGICVDGSRRCTLATLRLDGEVYNLGMSICNSVDNLGYDNTVCNQTDTTFTILTDATNLWQDLTSKLRIN